MKVYFRNKAARLKQIDLNPTCRKCLFYENIHCRYETSEPLDCDGKGYWVPGESLDIFKL
jgi:hypothetical protein